MSNKALAKLAKQYQDDVKALDELDANLRAAKIRLAELEDDTSLPIDEATEQSAECNRVINDSEFRVKSISKRQ